MHEYGYVRHLTSRRFLPWYVPTGLTTLVLVLAACSGSDSEAAEPGNGHAVLERAFGRVQATVTTMQHVEFANTAWLDDVSGDSFNWTWGSLDGWATSAVGPYRQRLPSVLGIDLPSSDSLLTIGESSQAVMLVEGGQQEDDITSSATSSGWSSPSPDSPETSGSSGGDILASDNNPSQPLTKYVSQVKASDTDAILGGAEADLSVVDSGQVSLYDDPIINDLVGCLGDVVVALVITRDYIPDVVTPPVSVGVRHDPDNPETPMSVVCIRPTQAGTVDQIATSVAEAVASGEHPRNGLPYATYFDDPDVTLVEDGTTVRMVAKNTPEAFASTILEMTQGGALPGLVPAE